MPLAGTFRPFRFAFKHDPTVNDGEVSFFFDQETMAMGGQFILRNFKLIPLN